MACSPVQTSRDILFLDGAKVGVPRRRSRTLHDSSRFPFSRTKGVYCGIRRPKANMVLRLQSLQVSAVLLPGGGGEASFLGSKGRACRISGRVPNFWIREWMCSQASSIAQQKICGCCLIHILLQVVQGSAVCDMGKKSDCHREAAAWQECSLIGHHRRIRMKAYTPIALH